MPPYYEVIKDEWNFSRGREDSFIFFPNTLFDLISKAEEQQPNQRLVLSVLFSTHCSYFLR